MLFWRKKAAVAHVEDPQDDAHEAPGHEEWRDCDFVFEFTPVVNDQPYAQPTGVPTARNGGGMRRPPALVLALPMLLAVLLGLLVVRVLAVAVVGFIGLIGTGVSNPGLAAVVVVGGVYVFRKLRRFF